MFRRPSVRASALEGLYNDWLREVKIDRLPPERLATARAQFFVGFQDGQMGLARANLIGEEADAYDAGWQKGYTYPR
jgi:hypothetical protein